MSALSLEAIIAMASTVAVFWALPRRWPGLRWLLLSAAGFAYLIYIAPDSAALLAGITVSSFLVIRLQLPRPVRYLYAVAAFCLLLVLRPTIGGGWLWFGAAFYFLRVIHVMVEAARGALQRPRLVEYLAYMAFLPTLSVGPVERFPWFQRELQRWRWNQVFFSAGLETILYGYAQIAFLGNYLIDHSLLLRSSQTSNDVLRDWLECLRYGGALYFKFAGYSDIAIGFALLLGIRIRENFNRPYLAANIADFWRRWNISVTSWCRDYINLPALALTRNRSVAALASMIVLGLWHEVSWRYLLWGAFHGIGMAAWRGWRSWRDRMNSSPGRVEAVAAWALTILFVIASFAITKEQSVHDSLRALALLTGWRIS
jgi:D-alanyl-lipoteichoic acid acyltransferase DltB (MBOAT superfamily)